jgi:hypothetical protein
MGKTDALGRLDNGGVDADHLGSTIDQRPAAVARVESGIGLNHVVHEVMGDAAQSPAQSAHNTCGDRGLKTEGTADRHHQLADAERRRVAEARERQTGRLSLDDGQIGPGVSADHPALQLPAVLEAYPNALIPVNDVMVRQEKTVRREEDPRTRSFASTPWAAQIHDCGTEFLRHAHHHAGKRVQRFGFAGRRLWGLRFGAPGRAVGDKVLPES